MYRILFFLFFCCACPISLSAQELCCSSMRALGNKALEKGNFEKAIELYEKGQNCGDGTQCPDLATLIRKAEDKIKAETERKKREREAAQRERLAQQQRETERVKIAKEKEDKRLRDEADRRERDRIAQATETQRRLKETEDNERKYDKQLYDIAKSADNINAYKSYINSCSKCAFKADAQKRINELNTPIRLPYEPEMILVQGGDFQMGSNEGSSDEKPIHSVTLSNFYMGKYEIIVEQFKAFIDEMAYKTDADKEGWSYAFNGSSWDKKNGVNWRHDGGGNIRPQNEYNHPVIHVSWNDAVAYSQWLSRKTGKNYRLPTEAEWEYAARGGNKSNNFKFSGSNTLNDVAWNTTNSNSKTHTVGGLQANELGIYDMSGNVWEWCSDWYGSYSSSAMTNPKGASSGSSRVLRGGSWNNADNVCRVAFRNSHEPVYRVNHIGFRVVRND